VGSAAASKRWQEPNSCPFYGSTPATASMRQRRTKPQTLRNGRRGRRDTPPCAPTPLAEPKPPADERVPGYGLRFPPCGVPVGLG
jgi:hypothetical protein